MCKTLQSLFSGAPELKLSDRPQHLVQFFENSARLHRANGNRGKELYVHAMDSKAEPGREARDRGLPPEPYQEGAPLPLQKSLPGLDSRRSGVALTELGSQFSAGKRR